MKEIRMKLNGNGFCDIEDMDVEGKKVLVRVGMDITVDKEGNILDDRRIIACIPTIQHLVDRNAKVILMIHIGRPRTGDEPHLRTDRVAKRLSRLLFRPVRKLDGITGEGIRKEVSRMRNGDIVFLENLRFHPGEKGNDEEFAREIASIGDIYVNECFSVSHRKHASMVGIPKHLPSCAGICLRQEVNVIKQSLDRPKRPFVAILGGVKGDKVNAIRALIDRSDRIIVGGGLAFMFLQAMGKEIGRSRFDAEWLSDDVRKDLSAFMKTGKIVLPRDVVAAREFSENAEAEIVPAEKMGPDMMGLDIGPETIKEYKKILKNAGTVIWAGPMGVFEWERFSSGTREIARALSEMDATTVIGGGESAFAVDKFNVADHMTHVSTGGGAFMEYVTRGDLPAVEALRESALSLKEV